jgi:hypothetical protein
MTASHRNSEPIDLGHDGVEHGAGIFAVEIKGFRRKDGSGELHTAERFP